MSIYWKRNENEIKREIEERIARAEALRAAWSSVVIAKKKNGGEFEQIGRAVQGARVVKSKYAQDGEIELYISTRYETNGGKCSKYESDTLKAWVFLDELPEADERRQGRALVEWCVRAIAPRTADEIRAAIAARVEEYTRQIEDYRADLRDLPRVFPKYRDAVEKATRELEEKTTRGKYHKSLYYLITEVR